MSGLEGHIKCPCFLYEVSTRRYKRLCGTMLTKALLGIDYQFTVPFLFFFVFPKRLVNIVCPVVQPAKCVDLTNATQRLQMYLVQLSEQWQVLVRNYDRGDSSGRQQWRTHFMWKFIISTCHAAVLQTGRELVNQDLEI